ncbi:hypothetical protein NVP1208B_65 [Vibrio phage 1.208.B._10N.222.52.A7]|nr:hypothetical protein NVP1208B_65 [Vibrio phage 1.208.B._10N.222.52.A7]
MDKLIKTMALCASLVSVSVFASPDELEAALDYCNDTFKIASVTEQMMHQGVSKDNLVGQVVESAMPLDDKEIVVYIIEHIYAGGTPAKVFSSCTDAAFEMYGDII